MVPLYHMGIGGGDRESNNRQMDLPGTHSSSLSADSAPLSAACGYERARPSPPPGSRAVLRAARRLIVPVEEEKMGMGVALVLTFLAEIVASGS